MNTQVQDAVDVKMEKQTEDYGFTIWFTGLSGSGKSTIAIELKKQLNEEGCKNIEILDGDEIRKELNWDLGFSKEDRLTNLKRVTYVAKVLARNNSVPIVAFISPYKEAREYARAHNHRFIEVFINCPLAVCEERDVKGLYKKARSGEVKMFTGVSDPYEAPTDAEVVVNTHESTPAECANKIILKAKELRFL